MCRREHPRYALTLAITMQGDNNFYTGMSEDISESGVFIATPHVLPIGTPVVLSFTLPTSDASLSLLGTVQWVRGADAAAGELDHFGERRTDVKPGMGVRFVDVAAESSRAIRTFMRMRAPDFFFD